MQHGDRMLTAARRLLPGLDDVAIESAYIGWRPLPVDGHPVLGSSPGRPDVYLAIMHSGVSLAPIVGQVVAHELIEGNPIGRLEPFRPTREFANVSRY